MTGLKNCPHIKFVRFPSVSQLFVVSAVQQSVTCSHATELSVLEK
jgi:hypothetical protein